MSYMTGEQFEQSILRPTMSAKLSCRKCGSEFTFEEGGTAAISADIHGKVMCPQCHTVYTVDISPERVTLIADVPPSSTVTGSGVDKKTTWWKHLGSRRRSAPKVERLGNATGATSRDPSVDEIVDPSSSGSTKLLLAASHGDVEGVRRLLAQGANVNIPNKFGATALDVTYANGLDDIRYRSTYAEIASLLRSKGARANKWKGPTFSPNE